MNIGAHISSAKGFKKVGLNAVKIKANTAQFFLRNPRGSKAKELNIEDMEAFEEILEENNFAPVMAHAPYILNLCSKDASLRGMAARILGEDLDRLEYIPGNYYVIHPGNHVGQGVETGIEQISSGLNSIIKEDQNSTILLETMSGKGTELGVNFEELAEIISRIEFKDKVGVCFDTCHMYSAGYDIVTDLDGVIEKFDEVVGLEKLKAVHLNDSQKPFNSRKDRHAITGEGEIGMAAILNILSHEKLKDLPFVLETPLDLEGHGREIEKLRKELNS